MFHLPGLFWLVRLDDENFEFTGEDSRTAVLRVKDLYEVDRFQIMGPGNVPMHLSFETTYRMLSKTPTRVVPLSADPTTGYDWAGTIWEATATGKFSATSDDETFSVTGTMDSSVATEGRPGHMGFERNGVFLHEEDDR